MRAYIFSSDKSFSKNSDTGHFYYSRLINVIGLVLNISEDLPEKCVQELNEIIQQGYWGENRSFKYDLYKLNNTQSNVISNVIKKHLPTIKISRFSVVNLGNITNSTTGNIYGGIEGALVSLTGIKSEDVHGFKEIFGNMSINFDYHNNYESKFTSIMQPIFSKVYGKNKFTSTNGSTRTWVLAKV